MKTGIVRRSGRERAGIRNARRRRARVSVAAALAGALFGAATVGVAAWAQDAAQHLERAPLVIETADHRRHLFCVEIADDEHERAVGLMHRRTLDARAGMLFDYAVPRRVAMWMKNTLIPLDILFVRANGRVVNIAHGRPLDLSTLPSKGRVLAALELKGGVTRELAIRPGDIVRHPIFGTWDERAAALARRSGCSAGDDGNEGS